MLVTCCQLLTELPETLSRSSTVKFLEKDQESIEGLRVKRVAELKWGVKFSGVLG